MQGKLYSFREAIQAANQIRRRAAFQIERAAFAALLLLAVSFAIEAWRRPFTIGSLFFTNLDALHFFVIGLWVACYILGFQSGERQHLPRGLIIATGLWLLVLGISTLLAPAHRDQVLDFDRRIIRGVVLAWITFDLARSPKRFKMVIRALALGGIVVYLFGLAEVAQIPPVQAWLVDLRGESVHVGELLRLSSTLGYPTIAAIVIELTLFPLIAWILETRKRWLRLCLGVGLLMGLLALILTFSRGGLIAFCIGLMLIAGLTLYHRQRRALLRGGAVVTACLVVGVGLLVLSNPVIALRFITEDDRLWYQAVYNVSASVSARPGEPVILPVRLTNTGLRTWQASGSQPFSLGYHLLGLYAYGRIGLQYNGQRTALPGDVGPGESVTVSATVAAPSVSGDYLIEWDMVQEGVTWFSAQGNPIAETKLSLQGEPASDAPPFEMAPYRDKPPLIIPNRLTLWQTALRIAADYPLFGVGPDNFRLTYGTYLGAGNWNNGIHANNMYLEWLADTGLVGLLAFCLMSFMLARAARLALKQHRHDSLWLWQLALIGSLVAWYVHGFVDYFYEFASVDVLSWILVGLSVNTLLQDRADT